MELTVIRCSFVETVAVMALLHFLADFTLQGWLADAKQRSWWEKQVTGLDRTRYRYDYVVALVCHSLYWSLMVCAPFLGRPGFLTAVLANTALHAFVDHMKANVRCINLAQDQAVHAFQIVATAAALS